jgi:hypothetical protein
VQKASLTCSRRTFSLSRINSCLFSYWTLFLLFLGRLVRASFSSSIYSVYHRFNHSKNCGLRMVSSWPLEFASMRHTKLRDPVNLQLCRGGSSRHWHALCSTSASARSLLASILSAACCVSLQLGWGLHPSLPPEINRKHRWPFRHFGACSGRCGDVGKRHLAAIKIYNGPCTFHKICTLQTCSVCTQRAH